MVSQIKISLAVKNQLGTFMYSGSMSRVWMIPDVASWRVTLRPTEPYRNGAEEKPVTLISPDCINGIKARKILY
jgi:hypothetical protein